MSATALLNLYDARIGGGFVAARPAGPLHRGLLPGPAAGRPAAAEPAQRRPTPAAATPSASAAADARRKRKVRRHGALRQAPRASATTSRADHGKQREGRAMRPPQRSLGATALLHRPVLALAAAHAGGRPAL